MDRHRAPKQPDPLLLPFLRVADEAEAQSRLERLMTDRAGPIIRSIIRRKWGVSPDHDSRRSQNPDARDAEDLQGEVVTHLLTRLREIKTNPEVETIADFPAYVAVMTYHACDQRLRQKYPQRLRLKRRLRHLLAQRDGFAVWAGARGEWLAGFETWRDRKLASADISDLGPPREDPRAFVRKASGIDDARQADTADLLADIFHRVGGPIELDELVALVSGLSGIQEGEPRGKGGSDVLPPPEERLSGPSLDVAEQLEQRAYLQQLWAEIQELPPRQSAALLLNLRDPRGRGVIALLPLIGVATLDQIAEALAIPAEQFMALWNDLPLDDASIAERLGITRQQVINLRKVARERLARRMRIAGF